MLRSGSPRTVNSRHGWIASLCLTCLVLSPSIGQADSVYYLAPVINGHPEHGFIPVKPSHGGYIIAAAALKRAGLSPKIGQPHGAGYRFLSGHGRVKVRTDMATQTIYFRLPVGLRNRSRIKLHQTGFLGSMPTSYSASLSYNLDMMQTYAGNHNFSGTSFEGSLTGYLFTPFGS